jgi:hypothetical protein
MEIFNQFLKAKSNVKIYESKHLINPSVQIYTNAYMFVLHLFS